MNSLAQAIKGMADEGSIDILKVIAMAKKQDEILELTRPILDKCYTQVGLHLGEEIKIITSKMDGRKFDAVEFHYEKPIDGQE